MALNVQAASLRFLENAPGSYDYGRQTAIPAGFGSGEFTLEIWLQLDDRYAIGPTDNNTLQQRQNWSDANETPYSSHSWWYSGNFLLDGHNNSNFSNGTFSLQIFNGGRLRWLFGDGAPAAQRIGRLHVVQDASSPSLLDGQWHQITLVRRANGDGASLEMWIDGTLIDTESISAMTDMRAWWNNWTGFPAGESGWFWGAEKQAALNILPQYEDYKGNIDELRFWLRAKTAAEIIANYRYPVTGAELGLVGHFDFESSQACNRTGDTTCIATVNLQAWAWSPLNAPLVVAGDNMPPTTPGNLRTTTVQTARIDLAWNASTDETAVAYRITRNGNVIDDSFPGTAFSDTGLIPGTLYSYSVTAIDTSGNQSFPAILDVSTSAIPNGDGGGGGGGGGSSGGGNTSAGGSGGGGAFAPESIFLLLLVGLRRSRNSTGHRIHLLP